MNAEKIALVQNSFAKVVPIAEQAADLFYNRLFELNPNLRVLFKGDMAEQGKKLMSVLSTVVAGLTNLEKLTPVVQALGQRHSDYGVKAEDYGTVGEALIWTLQQGLGNAFDDKTKNAWIETYGILSSVMQDASSQAA